MQRIITSLKEFFGLSGSARAARHIGRLEKTAQKLNAAVDQINADLNAEWEAIDRETAAFEMKIGARAAAQSQRVSDKNRALRVALRLSSLVS